MGTTCCRPEKNTDPRPQSRPVNNGPSKSSTALVPARRADPPRSVKQEIADMPPQLQALLAAMALGFQPKCKSTTMQEINKFSPNGGTAMRDAIAMGVLKMISLQALFVKADLFGHFKFVHVILTDGEDNESKIPSYKLSGLLRELDDKLPSEFLKNIIIGVEVDSSTKQGLKSLASDSNGEFFDISSNEIENIFQKISLKLGIVT